jgi:hypothetical protein
MCLHGVLRGWCAVGQGGIGGGQGKAPSRYTELTSIGTAGSPDKAGAVIPSGYQRPAGAPECGVSQPTAQTGLALLPVCAADATSATYVLRGELRRSACSLTRHAKGVHLFICVGQPAAVVQVQ